MTTGQAAAARRVTYQLDTLWDFDYEPTHHELESLYERAKKNHWNGSAAIDWSRPIGKEGSILFTEVLIPRQQRLGLISPRLEPRYREIGLLG